MKLDCANVGGVDTPGGYAVRSSTARRSLFLLFLFFSGCLLEQGLAVENEVAKLSASDAAQSTSFGVSVRIDGDTVVVGAGAVDDVCPPAPDPRPPTSCNSGAAYIFERNEGGADMWGEVKKLTALDAATDDFFGQGTAIQGDTVVVGATQENPSFAPGNGVAYVFERDFGGANNWGQIKKLTASDGASGDDFGHDVAISGDTIAIGAGQHDVDVGPGLPPRRKSRVGLHLRA